MKYEYADIDMSHDNVTETGRLDRLSEALCYAAGQAAATQGMDSDVFLSSILSVHDHKGCLEVVWRNSAAAVKFGYLMANAWTFLHENEDMVEHFVDTNRGAVLLYYGRDVKNVNFLDESNWP